MIRTIAAALAAAFALVSFGVRADEPAKTDTMTKDTAKSDMPKKSKKAHKKAKKDKAAAKTDTTAPAK